MENKDELTADMLIARGQEHEKFAWMLNSMNK
jgi:DNA-binding ferritin-like protein